MHQYELTFGFREPYQVLGTILLQCHRRNQYANMKMNSGLKFPAAGAQFQDGLVTSPGTNRPRQGQAA
mgnify:CR=1 FL=1